MKMKQWKILDVGTCHLENVSEQGSKPYLLHSPPVRMMTTGFTSNPREVSAHCTKVPTCLTVPPMDGIEGINHAVSSAKTLSHV